MYGIVRRPTASCSSNHWYASSRRQIPLLRWLVAIPLKVKFLCWQLFGYSREQCREAIQFGTISGSIVKSKPTKYLSSSVPYSNAYSFPSQCIGNDLVSVLFYSEFVPGVVSCSMSNATRTAWGPRAVPNKADASRWGETSWTSAAYEIVMVEHVLCNTLVQLNACVTSSMYWAHSMWEYYSIGTANVIILSSTCMCLLNIGMY